MHTQDIVDTQDAPAKSSEGEAPPLPSQKKSKGRKSNKLPEKKEERLIELIRSTEGIWCRGSKVFKGRKELWPAIAEAIDEDQ